MWGIRLVDYYPAPKNWRVSKYAKNNIDVIETKEGFFSEDEASQLVGSLNQ